MARVCGPEPGVCELYLPNKRRYCRFSVVAGYRYCTHHLAARSDGTADRIPCPLDPAHSIFARDLRRHLKVCPKAKEAAAEASLPCFRRDVNAGEQLTAPGAPLPATASVSKRLPHIPRADLRAGRSRRRPPLPPGRPCFPHRPAPSCTIPLCCPWAWEREAGLTVFLFSIRCRRALPLLFAPRSAPLHALGHTCSSASMCSLASTFIRQYQKGLE